MDQKQRKGSWPQKTPESLCGEVQNFKSDFVDMVTHAFLGFCTLRPLDTLSLLYERESEQSASRCSMATPFTLLYG
jgi:hypothetical protein